MNLPRYTFPITMICFGCPTLAAAKSKLTSRLSRNHIVHQNNYKQADTATLMDIFFDKKPDNFIHDTTNTGQHFYVRKFGADFSVEMTRSVKQAIKSWALSIGT